MADIFEFPTQKARDWALIERALITIFRDSNVPQNAQTELLARMKSFCELLQMQFEFAIPSNCPISIHDELSRFAISLHERSNKLIMDRLYREIEILKLSGLL